MSEPRDSLRRRRQYATNGPETKILRKIAAALILLNFATLRTLREHDRSNRSETFQRLIEDHPDKIENEFSDSMTLKSRVKRYVRSLSIQKTYQLVLKPIDSNYYRDAIYMQISAYERARVEDLNYDFDDFSSQDAPREDLSEMVEASQNLYQNVKEAVVGGYLEKNIDSLKAKVESIDDEIEYACSSLAITHLPLVYSDNIDQT